MTILLLGDIDEDLDKSIDGAYFTMYNNFDSFKNLQGTGWQLEEIIMMQLNIGKYKPLRGAGFLELPKAIRDNKSILNIQNEDDRCFLWSILAALHPVAHDDHPYRVSKYVPYADELNMEGIEYPVSFKDIPKFVKQNNISVHVIGYEGSYFPAFQTYPELEKHVNLLLYEKQCENHYCVVRNVDRMLSSQSKQNGKRSHCFYCFQGFGVEKLLIKHREYCQDHGFQSVQLPKKDEDAEMKFTQVGKMLRVPFVIYADFEWILEPLGENGKKNIHKPCGYSYLVVSDNEKYQTEISFL